MVSSDVAWSIVRNNSAFLLKKRGVQKAFSTEPCNLTSLNSQRYNGLVNKKAVGITPAADSKGFVLLTKKVKAANKPSKNIVKVTMKAGPRRSLHKVKSTLMKQRYRKDLTKAAMRKASAIIRAQKPLPKRKGAKVAAKKE
uniref:Large ribosomal subunit protein eL28 n=1 Tax=Pseudodiaptomus poplesia TaxID=213370 RepID=A0A0U2M9Y4_9MAXI|nr:60S ribosomal protein L28 [Pseudodiaptomus poplesia]ALS04882.1 60S ribosomal protein L28 [Pseudodiaptomus poplesia]